jgi:pimeloyl-ACP methyl ester carboxylesterase
LLTTPLGRAMFANAVTRNGIDRHRQAPIFGGFLPSAEVRREAVRFSADLRPRYTMAAATAIEAWRRPVLVAWGSRDRMFPMTHAHRLFEAFPEAKLRTIEDSSTYVMLDQPDQTARAIHKFMNG